MKATCATLFFAAAIAAATPAAAQTYASYSCNDGARFSAAFYDGSAAVQLDGKALLLPQRLSLPGSARYSKSGVSITVRGNTVTLRRAGIRSVCASGFIAPFAPLDELDDDKAVR